MATSTIKKPGITRASLWSATTPPDVSAGTTITLDEPMTGFSWIELVMYSPSVSSSNRAFLIIPVQGIGTQARYVLPFTSSMAGNSVANVVLSADTSTSKITFTASNVTLLLSTIYGLV